MSYGACISVGVCEGVCMWEHLCAYNLIVLVAELPRGRSKDYFAMGKGWVTPRNLSQCTWWILFPRIRGLPGFVRTAPALPPPSTPPCTLSSARWTVRLLWNSPLPSRSCNGFCSYGSLIRFLSTWLFHQNFWTTLETLIDQEASHSQVVSCMSFRHYLFYKLCEVWW